MYFITIGPANWWDGMLITELLVWKGLGKRIFKASNYRYIKVPSYWKSSDVILKVSPLYIWKAAVIGPQLSGFSSLLWGILIEASSCRNVAIIIIINESQPHILPKQFWFDWEERTMKPNVLREKGWDKPLFQKDIK